MLKIKENIKPEEFEEIFGNTPFENIKKIKEYVNMHYVPYEQYVSTTNEINKKWEDKIKAKIEEIDIEIQCCEYADDDTEEYKQDMEKEKRRLLRDKYVLQSLLERE